MVFIVLVEEIVWACKLTLASWQTNPFKSQIFRRTQIKHPEMSTQTGCEFVTSWLQANAIVDHQWGEFETSVTWSTLVITITCHIPILKVFSAANFGLCCSGKKSSFICERISVIWLFYSCSFTWLLEAQSHLEVVTEPASSSLTLHFHWLFSQSHCFKGHTRKVAFHQLGWNPIVLLVGVDHERPQ